MNTVEASLLGWAIMLIWGTVLFLFKRYCLDKIKNGWLRYWLGMTVAYGILVLLLIASERNAGFQSALQSWRLWIVGGIPASILLVLVPASYSIFIIGRGYFGEGGSRAAWRWKLKMMASVFFSACITFFSLLFISFLCRGHSLSELIATLKESLQQTDWRWMLGFVALCPIFVLIMWLDHKKYEKKS